jgi:uncharacterized protein (TIGR02594 family)
MDYRLLQASALRKEPSDTAALVRALLAKAVVSFLGQKQGPDNDPWINVEFKPPGGVVTIKGWLRLKHCEEIADIRREEVNLEGFIRTCFAAEAGLNSLQSTPPWFVSADFVIARAVIETGITNAAAKIAGSDAVGPLQVASPEWNAFLSNAGPFAQDFQPEGRDHPTIQVYGATYRMYADMKAVSEIRSKPDPQAADGPFQPSNLDIFHAYLTNSPGAAAAIVGAQDDPDKSGKTIKDIFTGVLSEDQLKAFFAARSQYAGTIDAPKTVAGFIAATEAALNAALQQAAALITQNAPEELPKMKEAAPTPWFDQAEKAEAAGISESKPQDLPTILDYFASTSLGAQKSRLPWCGAFAAHCMEVSGNKALIPKDAARAANWKNFGFAVPIAPGQVPEGAVVVLAPGPGTGGSGHVSFFSKFLNNGNNVELLGGNQSRAVNRKSFRTSRVVAIRWIETAPSASEEIAEHPDIQASDMPISDEAFDLIVEFEVSGKAAYERKYQRPTWPKGQSGVTIGIGYDVGYQSPAQLRADCANILSDQMIASLASVCGVKGAAASPLAQQLRGSVDVSWDQAIALFRRKSIPRWVGVVRNRLQNTDQLSKDSLGALVSLTYNRGGGGYTLPSDRFREMRAIRADMAARAFTQIPGEIRSMKRLWPDLRGLQVRRDREAALFQKGLS